MQTKVFLLVYALGFIVTYGRVYAETKQTCAGNQCSIIEFKAFPAATVWPLYWPFRISIAVQS